MSFHTVTQLSKDGENHESTLANLHCSAIKNINWRALSQSQRRNFPSHLITEKFSHYLLFWNELHTFDSLTCKPCNGTIKAILISNQLKQINKMHYPQNFLIISRDIMSLKYFLLPSVDVQFALVLHKDCTALSQSE